MPPPPGLTPYFPITVAQNLRFADSNGVPVTVMYPVAQNQQSDNPTTGYISLIGFKVSDLLSTYQQVSVILQNYNQSITGLQQQVSAIQSSGVNFTLYVNGQCLSTPPNTTMQVTDAVTNLLLNTCSYNTVLDTPTNLAGAIGAQCTNLNTLPAFSQNSAMSGLTGWYSNPLTLAQSFSNLWKSYCDARTGISTALGAVTPTCSQIVVDYKAILNNQLTFNLYFSGYTFIPSGFTDSGSTVTITDSYNNIYTTNLNILTQSTTVAPLVLYTSGSTLSPTATFYQIDVKSKVVNSTIGLTCVKDTFKTVILGTTSNSSTTEGPDIFNYSAAATSGTTFILVSGLSYTPRFASIAVKDANTCTQLYKSQMTFYLNYIAGGVTMVTSGGYSGTINLDIAVFK